AASSSQREFPAMRAIKSLQPWRPTVHLSVRRDILIVRRVDFWSGLNSWQYCGDIQRAKKA
ncbi:MAG TPA: hypothetical protein VH022_00075, partial [Candidatus Acidoferrum sp.]|nr:hypothetical protein [Candidatus Acidoferrum sp.]